MCLYGSSVCLSGAARPVCFVLGVLLQALLLHNSIIKHAVYQNVGWVVEQEGDSFSVVFHEAEDAVAFTLQVGGGCCSAARLTA